MRIARLGFAVPAVFALALTGCAPGAPDTDSGATRTVEPPAVSDFCGEFEAAGGTLATIGAPPAYAPKEDLLAYTGEVLGVMTAVEPPAEIAEPWSVYLDYQERLQTEAEALPAGGRLTQSTLVEESTGLAPQYDAVLEYLDTNC